MNKVVPWNINGVGFDAREAAREAARRQGKSLGEWLHGVIADHATERGVRERDLVNQDRVDAVTSRLERMSTRSAAFDRRMRDDRDEERTQSPPPRARGDITDAKADLATAVTRRRPAPDGSSDAAGQHRDGPSIEETEFLLEGAIDAMEQRALQAEHRTGEALASVTKLLEKNEARRDSERESVTALTQKLSEIETRLGDREQNPIKGALARLEARLDLIGRRGAAEVTARQNATPPPSEKPMENPEPIRRFEEKLDGVLGALHARAVSASVPAAALQPPMAPAVSRIALTASQGNPPPRHRKLGEAIAEIATRQRTLDDPDSAAIQPPSRELGRREAEKLTGDPDVRSPSAQEVSFTAMQNDIASLAAKIDGVRRAVTLEDSSARPVSGNDLDGIHAAIASMSQALRDLAPREAVVALEKSISHLASRIEASRDHEASPRPIEDVVEDLRRALADMDPRKTIGGLEAEVRVIGDKIDDLTRASGDAGAAARVQEQMGDIRDLIASAAARPLAVEHIEHQIAALAEQIDRHARNPGASRDLAAATEHMRAIIANPPGAASFDKIEGRLEALSVKVDEAIAQAGGARRAVQSFGAPPAAADVRALENLVRDLAGKMEAVQAPGADSHALQALQEQINLLSSRFENSEIGLSSLSGLERSMRDLFAHLEETRASVETSAARAAREVLRIAIDDGRNRGDASPAREVAALKAMQEEADQRTQSTLEAVHETLEKVVDRLSFMENDIAEVRTQPHPTAIAPASNRGPAAAERPTSKPSKLARGLEPAPDMTLSAADPLLDPMFGPRPADRPKNPTPIGGRGKAVDLDEDASRADFIAAARRAAQAAQSDPSVVSMKRPGSGVTGSAARAGLMARSRDYVLCHKRPVLLGLAAIFVVVGTLAMIQRPAFDTGGPEMADTAAPAKIAKLAEGPQAPRRFAAAGTLGELTPSALPKGMPAMAKPIPGSDPIQTGSIPSLPAFAAENAPKPKPALPPGLTRMAEAGNSAAEYELATRYAEGSAVPHDFKLAAKWYARAAEQGIPPAQYRLASLYEKGLGVRQDKAKAKSLYLEAADAGNPRAMHNLAVLLADGDGKPDYEGAATWFRKAAQYGVHDSQYNLAILLARGLGVEQSLVQSYQWFATAAEQNDSDAARKRDEVGSKLGASDLAVAKALTAAFHPRRADLGATEVSPPAGGWDGASVPSPLNSPRPKIS